MTLAAWTALERRTSTRLAQPIQRAEALCTTTGLSGQIIV